MLEKTLKSTFGLNCNIEMTKIKGLPLYMMSGRKFYKVTMGEISFVVVEISNKEKFGVVALKKQLVQYCEQSNLNVAYNFDGLTRIQRDSLISKGIPFLSMPDQIYLPFLGVMLNNNFKKIMQYSAERMMPATQCLFLYLLYHYDCDFVIKKQAADELGLTRTSITRASKQLNQMKLINEKTYGKETRMYPIAKGLEFYRMAKEYLINPVQKVIHAEVNDNKGLYIAGESSLSKHSMLASPQVDTLAVFKGDKTASSFIDIDSRWNEDLKLCRIELWKYNPSLFSKNGEVDPISLALSLSENDDERVQGELQTYLEEYKW
ncbi:MAG: MarR family transcriptional regulator [Lachnospiraceae bacterium]|nr:MarR family transcriptional regulator [Lachnospiraceae bacterium]